MRNRESAPHPEEQENEPAFQYAEITYGAPGHELEYTMHVGEYWHDTEYIPRSFEDKLKKYYQGPEHAISNRGSRIEIHSSSKKGWPEPRREDPMVYEAANKALAEFAQEQGQKAFRLGPYGWKQHQEWLSQEFGEDFAAHAAEVAIYAVPEGAAAEEAQKLYDSVETFWKLVYDTKRETEDNQLLSGETAEERTRRNREDLEDILNEIEQARSAN